MIIHMIWWRRITSNDLYNIEKPLPPGPKGQLHIDIPNVSDLLKFFAYAGPSDPESWPQFEISAKCFRDPKISSPLTFRPRPKNTRYDIPQQNINAEGSERHPAWTSAFGWPPVHGLIRSTEEATSIIGDSELRIVVFLSSDGEYYADFVLGKTLPDGWPIEINGIFADKPAGCLDLSAVYEIEKAGLQSAVLSSADESTLSDEGFGKSKIENPNRRGIRHPAKDLKELYPNRSGRQGYGLSALEKKAVEQRAISVAINHFLSEDFSDVKDVGDQASYDLTMLRNGQIHFVEVKGTTGLGSVILLTRNEVEVHQKYFPHNALVVVSSIHLTRGEEPVASGGILRVILPWEVEKNLLEPMTFEYRLPD